MPTDAGDRRGVADHAGAPREHLADERLDHVEDAANIDAIEAIHVGARRGHDRADVTDAGIVDQDVERAMLRGDHVRGARAVGLLADVERGELGLASFFPDGVGDTCARFRIQIGDVDKCARTRQRMGNRLTNARSCTRHERSLPVESEHRRILSSDGQWGCDRGSEAC